MNINFNLADDNIIAHIIDDDGKTIAAQDVSKDVLLYSPIVLKRVIKNLMQQPHAQKHPNYYTNNVIKAAGLRIELAEP